MIPGRVREEGEHFDSFQERMLQRPVGGRVQDGWSFLVPGIARRLLEGIREETLGRLPQHVYDRKKELTRWFQMTENVDILMDIMPHCNKDINWELYKIRDILWEKYLTIKRSE